MMKFKTLSTIRRSFKGEEQSRRPLRESAPAAIIPPKKVIRALYDFQAETIHEISFKEGDFFHVIGNENDENWFEACNPLTGARGMVPVKYFEVLGKTDRRNLAPKSPPPPVPHSFDSPPTLQKNFSQQDAMSMDSAVMSQSSTGRLKREPLYGVALYEFTPERPDELAAQLGDPLIIIAQSNEEWFVGMHPGKLGGPGLIPVSFVEIRDPETKKPIVNVQEWMKRKGIELPGVEEWKRMNSVEVTNTATATAMSHTRGSSQSSRVRPTVKVSDISDVAVESFITQDDQYWFHIALRFKDGRKRSVYRLYEDFYNFQIHLLENFPAEAGKGGERILPYMPGPLSFVNEIITAQRRAELDIYVKELIALPGYIRECELMRGFFGMDDEYDEQEESNLYMEYQQNEYTGGEKSRLSAAQDDRYGEARTSGSGGGGGHRGYSSGGFDDMAGRSTPTPTSSDTIKVKVQYGEDLLAIRVPARASFGILWERVRDRLGDRIRYLRWKDPNGVMRPLDDSGDLQRALHETGGKLLLIAN